MWFVGARSVVHMLQFNGKQGGEMLLDAFHPTCAAPATVSERFLNGFEQVVNVNLYHSH
jgi:hypothetical protein